MNQYFYYVNSINNFVVSSSILIEIDELKNRQKQIIIWTGLFFSLLFIHMVIDPILHWSS